MYVLEAENLIRNYKEVKVLKGVTFKAEEGEYIAVMGRSGCGKTTLLKTLGLIDRQTEGRIRFIGKDTDDLSGDERANIRRTEIGFIFQDFYLMDSLSVEENIMLPMVLSGGQWEAMVNEAGKYAREFEIEHLLKKRPCELSGGEKQRAAICRALIHGPELILADEPTGNLDSKSGEIVTDALKRIHGTMGKTIIVVTHDPRVASGSKRIIFLKDGNILEDLERSGSEEDFYKEILERMGGL